MVINKNASKIYKFFVLRIVFCSLKFVVTDFVSSSFDLASTSIIPSHVITELSIILAKHFPCLQLHEEGFQV